MDYALSDRYLIEDGTVYLTGVQALVRVVLDRTRRDRAAGLRTATLISGYEGSPLAGYDLELDRNTALLADLDVVHRPGLNEELAATSVMGSQLAGQVGTLRPDGVAGVWYGKSPGLDRASDALRHANLVGTDPRGGAVALVGDDPAAKSSTVPCASEAALADLAIPTLYPADSQDVLDFGLHAHDLSRFTGLWSALKIVTAVADGAGTVRVHRSAPALDDAEPSGHRPNGRLLGADLMALEHGLHTVRLPRALEYARRAGLNQIVRGGAGDRVGIVAAGKTYLDVREALSLLGLNDAGLARHGIRLLKLGMIYPLEPEIVTRFAEGLDEVIVVEEKRSFVETAVKEVLYGRSGAPAVRGKRDAAGGTLFAPMADLDADAVAAGLARALDRLDIASVRAWRDRPRRERVSLPLLSRSPYFCSGCPHNSSTKAGPDTLVGAGIGCHAMVMFMPPEQVGDVVGVTQMGGEGAQWIGMAPFVDEPHLVQNLGDGTFAHSGSLAIRAAVAAGVNVTYKLLHNSAVAMTGGQDPVGAIPVPRLAELLLAEGVAKVVITSDAPSRLRGLPRGVKVRHRDELPAVQRELARVPGVTVLIHDQECAAEKRRKRRRGKAPTPTERVVINERICEGCGDCGARSTCLSVHPVPTEFGRKTRIHQASCNLDYSCLDGDCPSFVTVRPGGSPARRSSPVLEPGDLPAPAPAVRADTFRMRITGVGGTGIVTVAQILATAAVIEGREVRSLDQTGLAQKGGAVVSDLTITTGSAGHAAKLGAAQCDLYLGCDALVAADPARLKVADPARTVAVVSTTEVPTGHMVADTSITFPESARIRSAVQRASATAVFLDAGALARRLLGDEQHANLLLVGAAYQSGAIPLDAESIEQAITLNGVAVAANLQAFRQGRRAVSGPGPDAAAGPAEDADGLLAARVADLTSYQNAGYAREYEEFVGRVRAVEEARVPGSTALTEAVTRNLHKLMAYKDEYEVARLALDPAFAREIAAEHGRGSRLTYRLHPPVLRALGVRKKIAFGPWFRIVFRALHTARRLRGTPFDPFGHSGMRRLERRLITEYRTTIDAVLPVLTTDNHDLVTRIAALPDMIRGYEQIKLDNVGRYHEALASLRSELSSPGHDRAA